MPVIIGFRMLIMWASLSEVITPSSVPNIEPNPSINNIKKNIIDQIWGNGNWIMASVKTTNASPVPSAAWNTCIKRFWITITYLSNNLLVITMLSVFCHFGELNFSKLKLVLQAKKIYFFRKSCLLVASTQSVSNSLLIHKQFVNLTILCLNDKRVPLPRTYESRASWNRCTRPWLYCLSVPPTIQSDPDRRPWGCAYR